MGPNAAVWGGGGPKNTTHTHTPRFTLNPRTRQPRPCVGQSGGVHLTAGALPPSSGLSLALSQFLPGSTHTSASTAGTLGGGGVGGGRAHNGLTHAYSLLLSQADTRASLKHASCFARTVRYLHRGLSHSDCGLVPQSSKRWLESE